MPRGKIEMSLIGDARGRAKAFARRKEGLVKKAQQLAKLCDVDVALVCAGPDGSGAPVVWESDPGAVIDRYRALPPEKRAKHTHLGYINGQLGKEEHRLARKRRQGLDDAFACPGEAALGDMDLQELLASIDAALLATAERQKALGVADDGQKQLGQVSSSDAVVGQGDPLFVGGHGLDDIEAWVNELTWDGVEPLPFDASMMQQPPASGVIQYINGNGEGMGCNHQYLAQAQQMPPGNGENGHGHLPLPWHGAYQPNTALGYGYQCTGDNSFVDMDAYSQMPAPSSANANAAYDGWSRDAVLPAAAYPSLDMAGNPGYMPVPPQQEQPSMSIGGSFVMDAGGSGHEYETGCLSDYLQLQCQAPDGSQRFGAQPELLHYFSDIAQGIGYSDGLEGGGWRCSSGRAQLVAQSRHSCSGSGTPQFSGSEQSLSVLGQQYQDPGVQRLWMMEGPPGSTDVAAAARGRGEGTRAGGLYQPCIKVYQ